jgi:hypothetical protein
VTNVLLNVRYTLDIPQSKLIELMDGVLPGPHDDRWALDAEDKAIVWVEDHLPEALEAYVQSAPDVDGV